MHEIEKAYSRLAKFFNPESKEEKVDPSMKLYFDDLTLAYKTLINPEARASYDEYISQQQSVSNYWQGC
jgi:DnaJ-class molecular chaperone